MHAAVEISMYPLSGDYRPPIQPQLVYVMKVLPGLAPLAAP
jgi:hypothetical protein